MNPAWRKRPHTVFYALCFYFNAILILSIFTLNGVLLEIGSAILPTVTNTTETMTTTTAKMPYHITELSAYENSPSIAFEDTTLHDLISVENLRSFKILDVIMITNTSSQNTMKPFLTYENSVYEIKIKYPVDWQKKVQETNTSVTADNNIVVTFAPQQQQRSPRLFIQVERLDSQDILLDQYASRQLDRLEQLFGNGSKIIEQSRIILPHGDIPAHRVVYEFKLSQIDYKKMDIWTIKDDLVFIISYVAEKGNYENYLPTIQKMIDAFEISNP
jgi:mannitol/fructose-specific phosphotransferase system IIA component (Ntr-type)